MLTGVHTRDRVLSVTELSLLPVGTASEFP